MKTFLTYLTFAALLALCYIEKMHAEAAKRETHAMRLRTQAHASAWAEPRATLVRLRE